MFSGATMAKVHTVYICSACGYKAPKWLGRCSECGEYNTFVEGVEERKQAFVQRSLSRPIPLSEIKETSLPRFKLGMREIDRLTGDGVVAGSVNLIGGDPGIGKSTLLLQMADKIGKAGKKVLYVSAEESMQQIKLRADRLGISSSNIFLYSESTLDSIKSQITALNPEFVVIDSIQMIYDPVLPSLAGSVSQVRQSAGELTSLVKEKGITLFIIGHVTKEGAIAGPKTLEHMVDAVFYFEGERFQAFRVLRSVKNRFGSTNEVAIFEMRSGGLVEVENPSELFLSQNTQPRPGSVITATTVGTRAILAEVQALTASSSSSWGARRVSGIDFNRASIIVAILEKRCGFMLHKEDVFITVVGGMTIEEPAADAAIASAIASSYRGCEIPERVAVIGELGLTGEVRGVSYANLRVGEAVRLGIKKILVPRESMKGIEKSFQVACIPVSNCRELLETLGLF